MMQKAAIAEPNAEPAAEPEEVAGYVSVPGAELYTVLHTVARPAARVLLVGPFASERHFAYPTWVRWARHLAARGVEALRYDYRGVGESTGSFAETGLAAWAADVGRLAGFAAERSPRAPLLLHGLEMGALLAARAFAEGCGDGLVLWSPPADAHAVLRSTLQRWAMVEQLSEPAEHRRSPADSLRELERGQPIHVQGYQWTTELWRESREMEMPAAFRQEGERIEGGRPVKITRFGPEKGPLGLPYARFPETRDLGELYGATGDWILAAAQAIRGAAA